MSPPFEERPEPIEVKKGGLVITYYPKGQGPDRPMTGLEALALAVLKIEGARRK